MSLYFLLLLVPGHVDPSGRSHQGCPGLSGFIEMGYRPQLGVSYLAGFQTDLATNRFPVSAPLRHLQVGAFSPEGARVKSG